MAKGSSKIKAVGDWILRLLEMIFDFVVRVLKLVPAILRSLVWLVFVTAVFGVILLGLFNFSLSTLGLNESPVYQQYRDQMLEDIFQNWEKYRTEITIDEEEN